MIGVHSCELNNLTSVFKALKLNEQYCYYQFPENLRNYFCDIFSDTCVINLQSKTTEYLFTKKKINYDVET